MQTNTTPTEWRADSARYLSTDEAAAVLRLKPHTLRTALCKCGAYYGVKPVRAANRFLLWPVDQIDSLARRERIATPGGRFRVRWDEGGAATALGQLPFFAEFLEATGLFERWVEGCPMTYKSPNAPRVTDVLGTWLLSILDGQRRYAHVAGWRGDNAFGVDRVMLEMEEIGQRYLFKLRQTTTVKMALTN